MSVLSIIQDAAKQLSLNVPTGVVGVTSDDTVVQMLRLSNTGGKAIAKRHSWERMTKEHTFTTVADYPQTDSIPTDFDRMLPESMFNRTRTRRVVGPMSQAEWQEMRGAVVVTINPVYRIRGGSVLLSPIPTAGDSVYYEYVSKNWCQSAASVEQSAWAADTDTALLDEELLTLDLVWRFKQMKGLDFAFDQATFEERLRAIINNDGTRPRLSTEVVSQDRVPRAPLMPETFTP